MLPLCFRIRFWLAFINCQYFDPCPIHLHVRAVLQAPNRLLDGIPYQLWQPITRSSYASENGARHRGRESEAQTWSRCSRCQPLDYCHNECPRQVDWRKLYYCNHEPLIHQLVHNVGWLRRLISEYLRRGYSPGYCHHSKFWCSLCKSNGKNWCRSPYFGLKPDF